MEKITKHLFLFITLIFCNNFLLNATETTPPKNSGSNGSDPGALSLTPPVSIISSGGVLTISTESEELISVTIKGEEYLTSGHYFSIDLNHLLGEEISVLIVTDNDTYNAEISIE